MTVVDVVGESADTETIRPWVAARRSRAAHALVAVFLLFAALIALAEIDRLIAGVLTPDGRSSPLGGVLGPLAFVGRDAWSAWSTTAVVRESLGWWILASVWVDGVFIVAYAWILSRLIRRIGLARPRRRATQVLAVLIIVEGVEAAALVAGAIALLAEGGPADALLARNGPIAWAVAVLASLKWAIVLLIGVIVMRDAAARRALGGFLRRLGQALWLHRLSTVLVVALVATTCIPSDGVLDQLPDLQRQWVPLDGDSVRHALFAIGAIGIAMACALVIGRARTRALASAALGFDVRRVPSRRAHALWWCAPIASWVVLWFATGTSTGSWLPGWSAVAFLLVPVLIILSYVLWPGTRWPVGRRLDFPQRARWAWLTGDAIAVSIVSIAGLGLVRSFTAPVFSGWDLPRSDVTTYALSVAFLFVGVGLAVGAPILLLANGPQVPLMDPRVRVDVLAGQPDRRRLHRRLLLGFFFAGLLVLAFAAVFPVFASQLIGAPGLVVLLLTAWGAVLGAFTVALQERPPAPPFRVMRLRADPVLTLAITLPLIWSVVAAGVGIDDAGLHATRTGPAVASADTVDGSTGSAGSTESTEPTPTLGEQLDLRLGELADLGCEARTTTGEPFIPALVVVAEGGGIRAAYWTARALERLRSGDECLGASILLSSGVSGGSVGLAITALESTGASADLVQLADPDAVGTGVAGLLVGDVLASTTGLRFPSILDGDVGWRDRAALIEEVWLDKVPGLAEQAELAASDRIGIPVLNSTDVRSKCKVLVSNGVATSGADDDAAVPTGCDAASNAPAASLQVPAACFAEMEWATAAMLSARFPVITPAARIERGPCGDETMQLVDGGYAEGSGLGTAADLAPTIADRISEWNTRAGDGAPPIVPILVYLKNSAGYDLREDLEGVAAEPLVPVVGFAALSKDDTEEVLLQRAAAAFGTVGEVGGDAGSAVADLQGTLPGLVVAVAPSTEPAVVPPLGWALSSFSVSSLERAMARQLEPPLQGAAANLSTLRGLTGGE